MGFFSKLFGKKENVREREGKPDVYDLPSEDERMNWAIEKSQLTLHYFEECLNKPKDGQQYFSVKARIEDNGNTEHIWLVEPEFDTKGNIHGTIGNHPIDVTNVTMGERIQIALDETSDWMIIEQGRLIGGYTIRAIRDGFTGKELENFDESLDGMLVDDGEDYFKANYDTPEGAIICLENAYDDNDLEAAINSKDFFKEAELMLSSTGIESDDEIIKMTSETLQLGYTKSLEENGMPNFKNVKRAFRRRKVEDNHFVITEICMYPDGGKSYQKLNTYKTNNGWKVLGLEE